MWMRVLSLASLTLFLGWAWASDVQIRVRSNAEDALLRSRHERFVSPPVRPAASVTPGFSRVRVPQVGFVSVGLVVDGTFSARIDIDGGITVSHMTRDEIQTWRNFFADHAIRPQRFHALGDESIARVEARAMTQSGRDQADWASMLLLVATDRPQHPWLFPAARAQALAMAARGLPGVSLVLTEPVSDHLNERSFSLRAIDRDTDGVDHLQGEIPREGHLGHIGIRVDAVHRAGILGRGVSVHGVEFAAHDQLAIFRDRAHFQEGARMFVGHGRGHGSAVMGLVLGDGPQQRFRGVAPLVSYHFWGEASLVPTEDDPEVMIFQSRTAALFAAAARAQRGDVVMLQMQTPLIGPLRFAPAETQPGPWLATRLLTDLGVSVVAAAGNGMHGLTEALYPDWYAQGDSGALIVASSSPEAPTRRYRTSSWGPRVDVHAWGRNNLTVTMGIDSVFRFGGTSAATAVVAGGAAILQSAALDLGYTLHPEEMRSLLWGTGIWDPVSIAAIGVRPDIDAAVQAMTAYIAGVPAHFHRREPVSLIQRATTPTPLSDSEIRQALDRFWLARVGRQEEARGPVALPDTVNPR